MITDIKPIDALTADDLTANAVWQYTNQDGRGDTFVRPIRKTPVQNLAGRVVGTQVQLENGSRIWALIGNVDVTNPRLTQHFLTISLERDGKWFSLARYHDYDYASRGPVALAQFFGLRVDEVFPIAFDIRKHVRGEPAGLVGSILSEPRERLSRAEIIALAVP